MVLGRKLEPLFSIPHNKINIALSIFMDLDLIDLKALPYCPHYPFNLDYVALISVEVAKVKEIYLLMASKNIWI